MYRTILTQNSGRNIGSDKAYNTYASTKLIRGYMIFESTIPVRYAETDKMGIVYHANYLIWFEVARTELLESLGYPYIHCEQEGLISPVLHCEADYATPLRYGDVAVIRTSLIDLTQVRCTFLYRVWREGQDAENDAPLCIGKTTHCFLDASTFKPVVMRKKLPGLFEAYQKVLSMGEFDAH